MLSPTWVSDALRRIREASSQPTTYAVGLLARCTLVTLLFVRPVLMRELTPDTARGRVSCGHSCECSGAEGSPLCPASSLLYTYLQEVQKERL